MMIPHNHDPLSFSCFVHEQEHMITTDPNTAFTNTSKRKRNLPGHPDPNAQVISLSPKSLMATNRFFCEICNKGFQREQNLQLHRRGHNLPWKLKQRANKDQVKKKVYVCPVKSCLHHDPARALGDLTGIKKHFSRKHGEKKLKCDKCCKKYAVVSDLKAHIKICGSKDYICDCGTLFSRKDSFITHRAFCDALADETAKFISSVPSHLASATNNPILMQSQLDDQTTLSGHNFTSPDQTMLQSLSGASDPVHNLWKLQGESSNQFLKGISKNQEDVMIIKKGDINNGLNLTGPNITISSFLKSHEEMNLASVSATTLLQKAAQMGSSSSSSNARTMFGLMTSSSIFNNVMPHSICFKPTNKEEELTRDFLGVGNKNVDQQRLYHHHFSPSVPLTLHGEVSEDMAYDSEKYSF